MLPNFDKLSVETLSQLRKISRFFALGLVLLVGLFALNTYVSGEVKSLEAVNVEYNSALSQLRTAKSSLAASEQIIKTSTGISSNFMTKEEFLSFVGSASKSEGCDIMRISGGNPIVDGIVTKMNFSFELKGTLIELYQFMERLEGLQASFTLNNISMRKTEDFEWLDREDLDSFNLEWWTLEINTESGNAEEEDTITLDKIFGTDEMTMYLDLDFVVSDGA